MRTVPSDEARLQFAELLGTLDVSSEPVLISRRGQAAAALMSVAQYQRLVAHGDGAVARLRDWRAQHASVLAEGVDLPDPWADVRDRQPRRAVDCAQPTTARRAKR